jgi:hypothetical protein
MTREQWRDYWRTTRLRLQLECCAGDADPWVIFQHVEVEYPAAQADESSATAREPQEQPPPS